MCSLTRNLRILAANIQKLPTIKSIPVRSFCYKTSPFVEDLGEIKVDYEVSKDPQEWKYVERLLRPTIVPTPTPKESYPSGWIPQAADLSDRPYFIDRTKNHMIPVYMRLGFRNTRRTTVVRKIHGDIWLLEKELRDFLQQEQEKPIRSQVNEFAGFILFHGDHVNAIKYFLEKKGY